MKFDDVLYNFISPVTGRIYCDHDHVLVGNSNGVAVPTPFLPITTLPDLTTNNFWVGDTDNRPQEVIVDIPLCFVATTINMPGLYNNGLDGIGATLIISASEFFIDGIVPPMGSTILIKNQEISYQNGIYIVTLITEEQVTLTRTIFYDQPYKIREGDSVSVKFGLTNSKSSWVQTSAITTVGIDSISYIGPMGPAGPQGPVGPRGPAGGAGTNIFGKVAEGIGKGIGSEIIDRIFRGFDLIETLAPKFADIAAGLLKGAIAGPPGAAGTAGLSTVFLNANLDLNGGRLENIAQSPGGDYDAISARFLWDLLNDNVVIQWENF